MNTIIISILIIAGALFVFIAAVGIIRFDDLYSRMHATTKATSFGLLLLLAGVSIFFLETIVFVKAFLIIVFIYLTAPLAAHSIAKSFMDDQEKKSD
ncbi:MAG: monovalent cation/H(+) antiporter subunit G [Bacteroidales bacterium]|nr:monovalent cation/H(+) antiporter subunit G [Bacteroidales bacterium]